MRYRLLALLALFLGAIALPPVAAAETLDEGLLDPSWFGGPVEFRTTADIDYLWVKPGFTLAGRTLNLQAWDDPKFLAAKKKRDAKDSAKASELTDLMPSRLFGGLSQSLDGVTTVSKREGDLILTGRIVDCDAGSKAAKFLIGLGAGSAGATWDIKIVDASSKELLLAVHHRAISVTSMSEIDDKVIKWIEKFGGVLRAGADKAYAEGKAPTK
jgi:hypothetical protein